MNRKKIRPTFLLIAAIVAVLTPSGLAASGHRILVEIELEGDETCPALITASAQSCDRNELAEMLCSELESEGLPGVSPDPDDPQKCSWLRATSGCTEVRERLKLEPGPDCEDGHLEAYIRLLTAQGFGEDGQSLVEVEIEIPDPPQGVGTFGGQESRRGVSTD